MGATGHVRIGALLRLARAARLPAVRAELSAASVLRASRTRGIVRGRCSAHRRRLTHNAIIARVFGVLTIAYAVVYVVASFKNVYGGSLRRAVLSAAIVRASPRSPSSEPRSRSFFRPSSVTVRGQVARQLHRFVTGCDRFETTRAYGPHLQWIGEGTSIAPDLRAHAPLFDPRRYRPRAAVVSDARVAFQEAASSPELAAGPDRRGACGYRPHSSRRRRSGNS